MKRPGRITRPKCKQPVAFSKIHLIPLCTKVFCPLRALLQPCPAIEAGDASGLSLPHPNPSVGPEGSPWPSPGSPLVQGCPQPSSMSPCRGKMEKEKERARLAGVIQAEPSAAEVAEDTQKERRLFQLHMCEVGAAQGGVGGPLWSEWCRDAGVVSQPHRGSCPTWAQCRMLICPHPWCLLIGSWLRDPPVPSLGM